MDENREVRKIRNEEGIQMKVEKKPWVFADIPLTRNCISTICDRGLASLVASLHLREVALHLFLPTKLGVVSEILTRGRRADGGLCCGGGSVRSRFFHLARLFSVPVQPGTPHQSLRLERQAS